MSDITETTVTEVKPETKKVDKTAKAKTLTNVDIADVKIKVPDVKVVGDGNLFKLLCKASSASEGWMKSTKAMEIPGVGCVVQVTTQQLNSINPILNSEGATAGQVIAEAVTFVPDTKIIDDVNGGRKLVHFKTN